MSGSTTWYAVWDSTGALVSVGTVLADPATLAAKGLAYKALTGDPTGQVWDPINRVFNPAPPIATAITTWQFIQRFTPTEFAAIEASTDAQARMFLLMLQTSTQIVLSDAVVQGGLQYLVSIGLLTSDRAATIGAH